MVISIGDVTKAAMATTKLTVQEVLISLEEAKTGAALFRATDKKLYVSYSTVSSGDKLDYSYPPTELQDIYPVASAPNITGGVFYEVQSTLVDPDNNEFEWVAYAAYEPKTRILHIEENAGFKAQTYKDPETGEKFGYYIISPKIFKYTGIQLLTAESKYDIDFNGDKIIGDAINATHGAGIYSTASGGLYWSPQEETEGSAPSADAKLISSDAKFISSLAAAYELLTLAGGSLASRPIALDKDREENDAQVAFPIYKAVKNSDPIFASLNLYDINSGTGKYKVTAVTKPIDILKYEVLFDNDFNGDTVVGDAINASYGAGMYSTASGGLYWSPQEETEGSAPSADAKLISSDAKFISSLAAAYELLTLAGGSLASRPIALDKDREENDAQVAFPIYKAVKNSDPIFASLNLYDINSGTGKYKVTAVTKPIDILRYEVLFDSDFNRDEAIGDAIIGEFGAGICKTASGSLYWSPAPEPVGLAPSSEAKLLSSDPKFVSTFTANYDLLTNVGGTLASRQIALDKDKIEDDSQVALPVFRALKNGEPVFSSLNLYDINSTTGKYKLTSYSKAADIYKHENLFGFDFNNDGATGNPLTAA